MRYHIDTIPVWDAVKAGGECPLCLLRRQTELRDTDRFLGGSVMEPDVRVRVNDLGFCQRHHVLLYAQQNRLGHALMTHTHMRETREKAAKILDNTAAASRKKGASPLIGRLTGKTGGDPLAEAADALDKMTSSCILCDSIQSSMDRYTYTMLHLYTHDPEFRQAFVSGKGLCLKDAAALLRMASRTLSPSQQADLSDTVSRLMRDNLKRVEDELEWFTLKFDYRNADKPWNNSRDALERAVNKLRGWCLGLEPDGKKE